MEDLCKEIRRSILTMIFKAQTSHIGSNFSCVDLLTVLYEKVAHIPSATDENRDRIILSKGWAAATVYTLLQRKGILTQEQIDTYGQEGGLIGLVERTTPGIEASTGSMGHGLPIAVGMALAAKRSGKSYKVYVLMSDGEMNCGTTWESALLAAQHKLDNLVVIVDCNKWQAMGRTEDVLNTEPLMDKWYAFGWKTFGIDGHNYTQIEETLSEAPKKKDSPTVIIARTIKGKGVSFMEQNPLLYHYKNVTDEDYQKACAELS